MPAWTPRADELCELADAVLCADGPVRSLQGAKTAPTTSGLHFWISW